MSLQTTDLRYRLGFIGGGKLAGSLLRGLVRAEFCEPGDILVSEPNEATREALAGELGVAVTEETLRIAREAEVIFLGVKPGVVLDVVAAIAEVERLVISCAAGVPIARMEAAGRGRYLRAMTNTPAAVCQAATALARGVRSTEEDIAQARAIFSAVGLIVEVPESMIDAVTALGGSGPAFVYTVIEALAAGGTRCGLAPEVSLGLATQTLRGAAQLALESGLSPEELRRMVITPGGTTAAGLKVMEERGAAEAISAAVVAAATRARELMPPA